MTVVVQQRTAASAALIGIGVHLPGVTTVAGLEYLLLDPTQHTALTTSFAQDTEATPSIVTRQVLKRALSDASLHIRRLPQHTGLYLCQDPATDAVSPTSHLELATPLPQVTLSQDPLSDAGRDLRTRTVNVAVVAAGSGPHALAVVLAHHDLLARHRAYALLPYTATGAGVPALPRLISLATEALYLHHHGDVTHEPSSLLTAPLPTPPASLDPVSLPHMCPVSATSPTHLSHAARTRAEMTPAAENVAALADTALEQDEHHRVRAAVIAPDLAGALQGYRSIQDQNPNADVLGPRVTPPVPSRLVYVMTGLAGVHPEAGMALMRLTEFAQAVDEARQALAQNVDEPWTPGARILNLHDRHQATFVLQYALASAWRARGLTPQAVVASGAGEPAAAVVTGALSVTDAARVVAARSNALATLPPAGLVQICAPRERVDALIAPYRGRVQPVLYLRDQVWCAGPVTDLTSLHHALIREGVRTHLIERADASHTSAGWRVAHQMHTALRGLRPRVPERAHLITSAPLWPRRMDTSYWAERLCSPEYLDRAVARATAAGPSLLVEVAATPMLVRPVLDSVDSEHTATALTCEPSQFAHALGEAYVHGHLPRPADAPALLKSPPTSSPADDAPVLATPDPDHTQGHLVRLIERIVRSDRIHPDRSWSALQATDHDLVRLVVELRQVPAWRGVTTTDLDPHEPFSAWAQQLTDRMEWGTAS